MKIREKFRRYNIILLLTSLCLIGVISALFLVIFILKFPVEQLYITRMELINPIIFAQAVSAFFNNNPEALLYLFIYVFICVLAVTAVSTILTHYLAKSLERPISVLRGDVDKIRGGELSFEVMGSDYEELDDLSEGVDEMRRALLLSREREEQLKRERNMLVANVAHDLRTPITSIKGYIDGIRDGIAGTADMRERYLNTIKLKADMIDDLVSNLSLYSMLEVSGIKLNKTRGDLRELIYGILDGFRLDMEQNCITLTSDITSEPLPVDIDGDKMRRVYVNLIDNSVKYRSGNDCRIDIRVFADDGYAYVVIADNGRGIAQNELTHVFDSFYRADTSRSSEVKGNGLGLGIAKQLTEKHGGRLWLRSEGINKGTTATVALPLILAPLCEGGCPKGRGESYEKDTDN